MTDNQDPKDRDAQRNWIIEQWHEYGRRFSVFRPEEQPAPTVWDPDVPEYDDKGRVNPHYLKHWKFFADTKAFLKDRYGKYKILQGPSLYFDCLVRKFQKRIFKKSYTDEHGNPVFFEVKDTRAWYERTIRMSIFEWHVGFTCRSNLCERDWCSLHRQNPQRIRPVDIYGLVAELEQISLTSAKTQVGKWFGLTLGDLESKGVRDTTRPRRKVSKGMSANNCCKFAAV